MTAKTRNTGTSEPQDLMVRLGAAIGDRQLSAKAAAAEIGVTANTLERHLAGEHVRSDSQRKYEDWLAGRAGRRKVFRNPVSARQAALPLAMASETEAALPAPPVRPHLVVDLFSGCGGLSLGFDLLEGGTHFRTVLAIDFVPATVTVMNRNHARIHGADAAPVARVADLTEFLNEAEVLAFYMDHAARVHADGEACRRLHELSDGLFPRFLAELDALDNLFLDELAAAREAKSYRAAYDALDKGILGQTSVIGFQDGLKLPRASRGRPSLNPVIWADVAAPGSEAACKVVPRPAPAHFLSEAHDLWERQLAALEAKEKASGSGQLTSSGRRIKAFVAFARSSAFAGIREAWCRWQAARLAIRAEAFQDDEFTKGLRQLYEETYPVSVLLGGAPCQGFSRIGRGKIRSLREAHVHVHGDDEVGDIRNLLYQRYLLVVSALRPLMFGFENVQHFQSAVKTDGREFLATEILAEAIADMSEGEASYAVSSRTVDASKHGVPQTRQRFFMSGLRRDAFPSEDGELLAARCLALPVEQEVPLSAALDGLPPPAVVGGDGSTGDAMSAVVDLADAAAINAGTAEGRYRAWIRQAPPGSTKASTFTDAHAARAAREDDAELYSLFGPGKRWMDYRVDDAPTLAVLRNALLALASLTAKSFDSIVRLLPTDAPRPPSPEEARDILTRLDGSLALRLMMEQIGEQLDAPHHLVTPTYLSKRDGHHGDWLARLDPTRPCKTIVAHMGKDTYGYVHPYVARTLSVREAARVQTFPDWFSFGDVALTDALKMIGNAVAPLLSHRIAGRFATVLARRDAAHSGLHKAA